MHPSEAQRATAAARSTASALDLAVNDAIVLQDANRLVLRLMPCDVVARVAPIEFRASAELEVALARQLSASQSPVAALAPGVEPRVHARDGFVINLWTYCEPVREVSAAAYAQTLERLHASMRQIDIAAPHFSDRVADAARLVASRHDTPALADGDRDLLSDALRSLTRSIGTRGAAEQLLHGEPHPGNVLGAKNGPVFIDFETCCRGPVEFDIAHVPDAVSERYPNVDRRLLADCRALTLAMVATWRWRRDDEHPNGRQAGLELLGALRQGPPWPTLDAVWPD